MRSPKPTPEDIQALVAFLPRFQAKGFAPVTSWGGGRQEDGTLHMPGPNYAKRVEKFFDLVADDCWCDFDYSPEQAEEMLADRELVKMATLDQVKTMLTYCVRGERFCDGHWEDMISEGHIQRLLERLEVLAETG